MSTIFLSKLRKNIILVATIDNQANLISKQQPTKNKRCRTSKNNNKVQKINNQLLIQKQKYVKIILQ